MPLVDDEEWERRIRNRHAAVTHIMQTPEYLFWIQQVQRGVRAPDIPAPDPEDRTVSKRHCEPKAMKWRKALKTFQARPQPPGLP